MAELRKFRNHLRVLSLRVPRKSENAGPGVPHNLRRTVRGLQPECFSSNTQNCIRPHSLPTMTWAEEPSVAWKWPLSSVGHLSKGQKQFKRRNSSSECTRTKFHRKLPRAELKVYEGRKLAQTPEVLRRSTPFSENRRWKRGSASSAVRPIGTLTPEGSTDGWSTLQKSNRIQHFPASPDLESPFIPSGLSRLVVLHPNCPSPHSFPNLQRSPQLRLLPNVRPLSWDFFRLGCRYR